MNKSLFLACLFILPFLAFAQKMPVKKSDTASSGRIFLDVTAGLSLPLGSYASSDLAKEGSGFATPGFLGQVNLDWMGKDNFGLAIQYTFQHNSLKKSVIGERQKNLDYPIESGSWTNNYLLAGPVFLKFMQKLYIDVEALFGVLLSSSPIFNTTDPLYKTHSTNLGTSFAYGVQVGAGYAISRNVTVKADIEYIAGNPKIHRNYGAQWYVNDTGAIIYLPPLNVETKRNISTLMVKAGVVIKLSK